MEGAGGFGVEGAGGDGVEGAGGDGVEGAGGGGVEGTGGGVTDLLRMSMSMVLSCGSSPPESVNKQAYLPE